ncbi:hypothetical protein HK101_003822 [Irineochytrium annulatum]|nr:hypothetical protein HK101_003822 [Irineochytrium annulatum]
MDSGVDELHSLRNQFYLGGFQQVVNDATNPAVVPRSDQARNDRRVYLYRAYIAQGRYNPALNEITDSDSPELVAVKALAKYLTSSDTAGKEGAVKTAQALVEQGISSPLLAVVLASIFYQDGLFEDALKAVVLFPKNLECLAFAVQIYLRIDRVDLARKEVTAFKTWADDATLAQVVEAWVNVFAGSEDKYQEAFYTFDELASSNVVTPRLLTGKAVCKMISGKFNEAEELLVESLNRNSSDPETLANLIICAHAVGKPAELPQRYMKYFEVSGALLTYLVN